MKKKLALSVAILSIGSIALFSQPVKIEVYANQVLEKSYIGNGVQWSAYPMFDISEKSWQYVFERTDFMKLNFIRLVVEARNFCDLSPGRATRSWAQEYFEEILAKSRQ